MMVNEIFSYPCIFNTTFYYLLWPWNRWILLNSCSEQLHFNLWKKCLIRWVHSFVKIRVNQVSVGFKKKIIWLFCACICSEILLYFAANVLLCIHDLSNQLWTFKEQKTNFFASPSFSLFPLFILLPFLSITEFLPCPSDHCHLSTPKN